MEQGRGRKIRVVIVISIIVDIPILYYKKLLIIMKLH
jgi:hypothetical protein